MADWRQIRARIRRAKVGPDASTRLEQLFEKTRDGMVAFELARLEEMAGQMDRAATWYHHARDRFRRTEWKQRAEEALARLGVPIHAAPHLEDSQAGSAQSELTPAPLESMEEGDARREPEAEPEMQTAAEPPASPSTPQTAGGGRGRRRRGGRGRGRGRAQGSTEAAAGKKMDGHTPSAAPHPPAAVLPRPERTQAAKEPEPRTIPERRPSREAAPAVQVYRRVGEPALASVIVGHEAKLRQLLAAHAYEMERIDEAPASPGVYMVSDLDLTTVYYVEAYGNMRAAMDQLVSGRRGRQGSVRSRLAQYLGIGDSQASKYLKQHCVVRWLELEESDAVALFHFACAVFRPELNEGES